MTEPQPPLYPEKASGNARPCRDHSPECARWAKVKPDSCKPHPDPSSAESLDHSYQFMREACMESCGRCQDNVGRGLFFHLFSNQSISVCAISFSGLC